ncbi:HAMP domain-containing sensor histidine kinase [uncultured Prevotella sp.]|uniref:sensor histidine kinase n=1 Tax=uncultured Prevotella sp. TaxID=159272 RepID=UPI0025ED65D6|nr:HAMP domain-containing sensor histidine kinase [uncultured Prevotella sp.]
MKIGNKISLVYSMITIGLVVITALIFFFVTSGLTQSIYYSYLEEKAHALAEEKFSEDELDAVKYRNVVIRRQNSIPTSKEMFVNLADRNAAVKQLMQYLDKDEIERLFANQTIRFEERQEVGVAFVYYDNTGTFAVLVLSRNPFIDDINRMLFVGLIALVVLSSGVLYLISRLYAWRVLNRIDMDYQAEKMFVNNASHEINNPLTAIQGECEVALMMEHKPAEYRDILERISKETNRIITIMRELLQFAHAKDGMVDKSKIQQMALSSIVKPECKVNVTLRVVNDFNVSADAELLRIAIHNLVSNAVKYSGGNPVTVTINRPRLTIEDHGIGIPENDLAHIFQPFYRASNVGSVSGKGVGLALAKSILQRLGATINVTSSIKTGTTFCVTFTA